MIIRSIRNTGNRNLYDIHVPVAGNYLAHGIWNHNSGKTWAGARKLLLLHLRNAVDGSGRKTGVDSCIIAQTYGLGETVVIPAFKQAMDEIGIAWKFVADTKKYWFELPQFNAPNDPSLVYVRTADSAPAITGFTVGALWGDEVPRWKSDEHNPVNDPLLQAKGRLRDHRANFLQFIMTFTHEGDTTQVYEDFERTPKPDHKLYRSGTFENPDAKEFGESLRQQLTPTLAAQYLDGLAASLRGGLVYDSYGEKRNRDDSLTLDPRFSLQLALDFNTEPGLHGEVGQFDPATGIVTTVHELYEDRANVKTLIGMLRKFFREIGTLERWAFPGKLELFGDASGSTGSLATGESCWEVLAVGLQQMGIPFTMANVPAGNPHIADRVNAVNCAMFPLDGKTTRYKHHSRCVRLGNDYKTLKWEGNKIGMKDKLLSHASSADGYRIFQLCPIRRINMKSTSQYASVPGI